MSQDPNQFDLSSFSISSQEEKLAHQLGQTRLTPTHSIFSVPSSSSNQPPQQHVNNYNNTTNNSNTFSNTPAPTNPSQDWTSNAQWDTSSASQQQQPLQSHGDSDEGWGDGPPSYTSISQGTYFGFNSIMEASKHNGMPSTTEDATTLSPASQRAFGRFKNTPVTFTSAAAAFNPQQHEK